MVANTIRKTSNDTLWLCYQAIVSHYAKYPEEKRSKETTPLIIHCMLQLLKQVVGEQNPALEKVCLYTAQTYWTDEKQDSGLEPIIFLLSNMLNSKISYKNPITDNRLTCLVQILSIDNDHFDDFPQFLESINFAGLSVNTIVATLQNNFKHVSELQGIRG